MAGSSLLVLLDDIAAVLDDVAMMTKVAAKKTAGVLGDDLAVNAEKVTGVRADRELPVVWAVAKGSFRNKCILVPAALLISLVAPWLITPVLMLGGLYLCFEGFEKVAHKFLHSAAEDEAHHEDLVEHLADPSVDLVAYEKDKIKGAVRTDFILSAEIIVLTLGVVAEMAFTTQVLVVAGIAFIMTVGVYGLVAGIVKLDDAGLYLMQREGEGAWVKCQHWLAVSASELRSLVDESPCGCRHGGHVHGGWRYPDTRHSHAGCVDQEPGPASGGYQYCRPGISGLDAHPRRHRCGYAGGRNGAGGGDTVAAPASRLMGMPTTLFQ